MNNHAVAEAMVCSKSLARCRSVEPCQCSLDGPTAGDDHEALGGIGALDDAAQSIAKLFPGIAAIGEQVAQTREAMNDPGEDQRRAITVMDVGGVDHGVDQIALGVGQDVALAALGFRLESL